MKKQILVSILSLMCTTILVWCNKTNNIDNSTLKYSETSTPIQEVDDEKSSLNTYLHKELWVSFEYDKRFMVREEDTDYNKRIYIEDRENSWSNRKNDDLLWVYIEYILPSADNIQEQELLERSRKTDAKEILYTHNWTNIYSFVFPHNSKSESNGTWPFLEGIWSHKWASYRLSSKNWTQQEINQKNVDLAKSILQTVVYK